MSKRENDFIVDRDSERDDPWEVLLSAQDNKIAIWLIKYNQIDGKLVESHRRGGRLYLPKRVDRAVVKWQAKADKLNAEIDAVDDKLISLIRHSDKLTSF